MAFTRVTFLKIKDLAPGGTSIAVQVFNLKGNGSLIKKTGEENL